MKVIDSHVFIVKKGEYVGMYSTLQYIDDIYSGGEIVLMPSVKQYDDCIDANTEFINSIWRRDDIYPFMFCHPIGEADILGFMKENRIYGFKVHPSISQMKIDDDGFEPLLKIADEFNIPVLIHCGRGDKSRFESIINVVKKYNNPFIVAHLGGMATELIFDTLDYIEKNEIMKYPNIYFNNSGVYNPKLLKEGLRVVGHKRIVFGSDEPFHDFETQKYILKKCMDEMGFSEKAIESVFYGNIMRLLSNSKFTKF